MLHARRSTRGAQPLRVRYFTAVLVVALTGALGAGKSTVGRALASRGAVVIDADEVAREVIAPGSPGERAVLERWGEAGAGPSGTEGGLDRRALARLVFSSTPDRLELEAITHPLIRQEISARVADAGAAGTRFVVIELPLLDATRRRQYEVDLVVLIDAPTDQAVSRAVHRGLPENEARARIAAQPSEAERRALADIVVTNASDLNQLEKQVAGLWEWLQERLGPARPRAGPADGRPR
ncbi:MAG TPA: dephospho-CoA kinase [Acidimicrobiales bacterium]|nr:dephospho-CoA kinase [Acidimicrobiales bacterium]